MSGFFDAQKKAPPRISITSLMDVLTIILIFLLTNYSEEAPDPKITQDVSLPIIEAKSEKINTAYDKEIKVQLSLNKLEIENEVIEFSNYEDQEDQVAEIAIKKLSDLLEDVDEDKRSSSVITVHADKDVNYYMIDSLIRHATLAGITQIELIGMYEESK